MVIVSNLIASIIFGLTGVMIIYLKALGKLGMGDLQEFTRVIVGAANYVDQYVGGNLLFNIVFVGVLVYVLYRIGKKI